MPEVRPLIINSNPISHLKSGENYAKNEDTFKIKNFGMKKNTWANSPIFASEYIPRNNFTKWLKK